MATGLLPLLILVVGLAAATIWFVALPALAKAPPGRTCEVLVLESGTRCVEEPPGTQAAKAKSGRPKR